MGLKRFLKSTNGAAMVYIAISIVVLIGFTGLVIDGGRLYLARSQLQKAVDAGSLAGASALLEGYETSAGFNYSAAELAAEDIADDNYSGSTISYSTTFPGSTDVIEVSGEEKVPLFLMRVLQIYDSTVVAVAQAKLVPLGEATVIPIGIRLNYEFEYGVTKSLTLSPGDGSYGNYTLLNFSPLDTTPPYENDDVDKPNGGAKSVGYYIENGSPVPLEVGDSIETKTGVPVTSNPIQNAIDEITGDKVYVPIISGYPTGTSDPVTIVGFAEFIIEGFDKDTHTITATFIRDIEPGDMGEGTKNYGTYKIKLIK